MSTNNRPKKPALKDWSSAYIDYRLSEAGWTWASLAKHHGYASRSTFRHVKYRHWPKAERLYAEVIGEAPETIWPSRYAERNKAKCTSVAPVCNAK